MNPKQTVSLQAVEKTSHIYFDDNFKTFVLSAGNSTYSFCISPELTLEHLYWGKRLKDGYDLRYLSQSCRMSVFNTVEAAPPSFEGKIVLEADTLEEIQQQWKSYRNWKTQSIDDADYYQNRRLENYSWRIMSKATIASESSPKDVQKSPVVFDIPPVEDLNASIDEAEVCKAFANQTRQRSVSNPMHHGASFSDQSMLLSQIKSDNMSDFVQQNAMNKLKSNDVLSATERSLVGIVGKGHIRHHSNKQIFERQLGKIGKGLLCTEYSDHGTGDFRSPSFIVVDNFNGSAISPLKYKKHRIYRGKLEMPDNLPSIRCLSAEEASTLVVTLADAGSGLEVDLVYGKDSFFL
jgi:hypothetical protein